MIVYCVYCDCLLMIVYGTDCFYQRTIVTTAVWLFLIKTSFIHSFSCCKHIASAFDEVKLYESYCKDTERFNPLSYQSPSVVIYEVRHGHVVRSWGLTLQALQLRRPSNMLISFWVTVRHSVFLSQTRVYSRHVAGGGGMVWYTRV